MAIPTVMGGTYSPDSIYVAKVVLKARNPEVSDIVLENDAEYSTKYRAIAEFKGVVS